MKKKEVSEEMIIEHLPLVKSVALRLLSHLPSHVDLEDLIGYGVLGLVKASQDFDPNKKVKFSTYAFYRIRGAILDGLRALDWLPRPLRQKIQSLHLAANELANTLGREPSPEELAKHLHTDVEEVRSLLAKAQQAEIVSLEEELQDSISFEVNGIKHSSGIEQEELREILTVAINTLDEKKRLVLTLYYYEGMNLKEIGEILGLTESRISQILSEGVSLLREKLRYIKSEMVKY